MIDNGNSVIRLLRYKKSLKKFKSFGLSKVFSDNLAEAVGVSSSLVRKDFSIFDISGNKRGGYNVDDLLKRINVILGCDRVHNVVIAGAGKLGRALMNYRGLEEENIKIIAAFDIKPTKYDSDAKIKILPIEEMREFIVNNRVRIGVITVPEEAAQRVADIMILGGIRGILNFAPVQLRSPKHCIINDVNLELEFENIIYLVSNLNEKTSLAEEEETIDD